LGNLLHPFSTVSPRLRFMLLPRRRLRAYGPLRPAPDLGSTPSQRVGSLHMETLFIRPANEYGNKFSLMKKRLGSTLMLPIGASPAPSLRRAMLLVLDGHTHAVSDNVGRIPVPFIILIPVSTIVILSLWVPRPHVCFWTIVRTLLIDRCLTWAS
jgi:hypothetical protein